MKQRTPQEIEPDLELIELTPEHSRKVSFKLATPEYGRIGFQVCPIWKRGKLTELWIRPRQQPTLKVWWHTFVKSDSFQVTSYAFGDEPYAWAYTWCPEHKCLSMIVSPPSDTSYFRITTGTTTTLGFGFEER